MQLCQGSPPRPPTRLDDHSNYLTELFSSQDRLGTAKSAGCPWKCLPDWRSLGSVPWLPRTAPSLAEDELDEAKCGYTSCRGFANRSRRFRSSCHSPVETNPPRAPACGLAPRTEDPAARYAIAGGKKGGKEGETATTITIFHRCLLPRKRRPRRTTSKADGRAPTSAWDVSALLRFRRQAKRTTALTFGCGTSLRSVWDVRFGFCARSGPEPTVET